jgi:uncharacterized protein (DUF1778 family)
MGRPPKKPEDRRTAAVMGKVTAEERRVIEEWANHLGKTLSDFVCETMLEKCQKLHEAATSGRPLPAPKTDWRK